APLSGRAEPLVAADDHMSASRDSAAIGAEIESLVQRMGTLEDPEARAQAQQLVRLLMELYGEGLSRMLNIARTEGGGPQAVVDRFGNDPLIASLLVLHDLHPLPLQVRVERALAALAPHLPPRTHVHLVTAGAESVRVRIEGHGPGRGPSGGGISVAIDRAIREAAPEIDAIHIDGLGEPAETLLQIVRRPSSHD
ncbi:MAG: hypothetical protein ACRELC_00380, partial [Gemmatimonadota bacterium]